MINKVAVESSNISAIGWEDNTMEVQFKTGTIYRYLDVSKNVYDEFLAAKSKGKYFMANVRSSFKFEKVGQ